MPQVQMPFFPQGVVYINSMLAFSKENGRIVYVSAGMQLYTHPEDDRAAFMMINAQFCSNGVAKQSEIAHAFGIPSLTIKRAVKLYRQEGVRGFFKPRQQRGAAVLTKEVLAQVQGLFDAGRSLTEVAGQTNLKRDTLVKAVRAGRLHALAILPAAPASAAPVACSKSERSEQDSNAAMGMGASNVVARVAASLGQMAAVAPQFQGACDVPFGGVLFALPALLAMGLLEGAENFLKLPGGYYSLDSLLMLSAFMALARLKTIESLRYCAPGEWGKILGLDRIPEVRTMRKKLNSVAASDPSGKWCESLSKRWMEHDPAAASVLYIDGHVRVYHGDQTQLPKHYVTRQKLCLRATTDYWINAMDGQPFFVVNKAVDPGMIDVIEQDILPQLDQRIPKKADESDAGKANRHRFTLVFDREGYSPDFFARMKEQSVACLTYHKFPGENWDDDEFQPCPVRLHTGEVVVMDLAERGTKLNNKLWVREIRKRTQRGHQTAVLATDYDSKAAILAGAMFSRWSQENYFRYTRQHFGLDRLADYSTAVIPDTLELVNPDWRELDGLVRKHTAILSRAMAKFGATNMIEEIDTEKMECWIRKKADMQEEIEQMQASVEKLKLERKNTKHHITFGDLPEGKKFRQLCMHGKQFIDTIKMIAYRAETAMANILRPLIKRPDEARTLLAALYATEADIIPDLKAKTLTVRLHHMASKISDSVMQKLCDELNATDTVFPRTELRLVLRVGSS